MLTPRQLFRRLRDLVRGRSLDADVDDEIQFHLAMQTQLLVRQGMSPGQARARAQSDFGVDAHVSDGVRSARGLTAANLIDDAMRDVQFALRSLARSPAFTIVAVLTLALGIGATTAIFSVVNGVLLRALPYPDGERLVVLRERGVTEGRAYTASVSAPNFADWREQARRVEHMAALRGGETTVLGLAEPIRADVQAVSHDYFRLLGGAPMRGRTFSREESAVGGEPVAVVSHRFWRDRLGASEDLAQLRLTTLGSTYRVIGIMPERFAAYPEEAEVWVPLEPQNANMGRDSHNDETIARLAAGVSLEAAESELQGVAERLKLAYPTDNKATGAMVTGLRDSIVGPVRTYLRLLLLAVVAVLLVACVNLASANLARGAGRARELSIRTVLGAGRGRLARQLLTENVLIALVGGALGLLLAAWLVRVLPALNPRPMPRAAAVGVDGTVLLFALAVTVATGVLIGLLPALQAGSSHLVAGMASGGRGSAVGRSGMRRFLVATEVAFAVLLLVAAGLLVRSFRSLLAENAGFDASGVLAVHVSLPETRYRTGNAISAFYTQALDELRSIPGVERAGLINIAPLARSGFGGSMSIVGRPDLSAKYADYRIVSPEYFSAVRVPLLAGRSMTDADDSTSEHVTVINQAMAKRFFGDESPLGKQIKSLGMDRHRDVPMTVIGVVGDARSADLSRPAGPQHFVAYRQRPERGNFGVLLLRTTVQPTSVTAIARLRLRGVDANVLTSFETLDEIRSRSLGDRRFTMLVLGGFAVLALVLAAIGIYGVLAYSVARRTREIGVRMALGAARVRVVQMVLGDSLTPVVSGAMVGIVASLAMTRLMSALLYGVSATDPLTLAAVVAVLLGVGILASVVPAARAARVDPVVALKQE
jgi:putative ABC transport system permease protein